MTNDNMTNNMTNDNMTNRGGYPAPSEPAPVPTGAPSTAPAEYGSQQSGTTSRIVSRPSWSPAQVFAIGVGLVGTIFGAIALARTGTDFSNLATTHAQVAGMHYSALSAVVQLGAGIVLVATGMAPYAARFGCGLFGAAALVWGIVIVADTSRLFVNWGYNNVTGVVYIVAGAVLLLVAMMSPVFSSTRREVRTSTGQHIQRV
jgi:hypothetical protein